MRRHSQLLAFISGLLAFVSGLLAVVSGLLAYIVFRSNSTIIEIEKKKIQIFFQTKICLHPQLAHSPITLLSIIFITIIRSLLIQSVFFHLITHSNISILKQFIKIT